MSQAVRWYIIQTYSGYENAVKVDLERRVESMGMSDFIFRIIVPEETVIEKKADGKEKENGRDDNSVRLHQSESF